MRGPLAFLAGASWTIASMAAWSQAGEVSPWKPACGTPAATNATAGYTARTGASDREEGHRNGPIVPVQSAFGGVVERPTGATGEAPPPQAQAPPSVPGLPRPSAPTTQREKEEKDSKKHRVEAIQAAGQVAEERLLDVGIETFDPGVDGGDAKKQAQRGLSPELRRSEARFVSFHLKKTLEGTGNWGAVRVVPAAGEGLDLVVTGRLLESTGKRLALDIEARDATGRSWLRKQYHGVADTSAYRNETVAQEAFQEVYNRIANDLLHARDDLKADALVELRRVALLRFASQLQPQAYVSYLKSKDGEFELLRFPAADDPMMRRVANIRERDMMFVDTLNEYYVSFYEQMRGSYGDWRKNSYDEQDALDKIARESLLRKILGGAAILAGTVIRPKGQGSDVAQEALILGGMMVLNAGFQKDKEKAMHSAALKELANSFDADVAPLLVEVEGQQVRLTGSAETQFIAWRDMLREMFALETGLPTDPNAVVITATPPSR
jgi:hypothetical protein